MINRFQIIVKNVICAAIACLFLTSSILLPLGDFSLMKELPEMYHNYTKITSTDEEGIADFIGDYLLHGKEIFGHNGHDKTPAKGNEIQFRHQASPLSVVFLRVSETLIFTNEFSTSYPLINKTNQTPGYLSELFRPPLS